MSHSENKSRQTQTSATEVRNLNVEGNEGITVVDSDNVRITTTDFNAIENASDIARSALDGAGDALREMADLGFRGFDFATDVTNIGSETVLSSQRESYDLVSSVVSGATDVMREMFFGALEVGSNALASSQSQIGGTVQALQGIAKEQTTSDAARTQTMVLFAIGAVVAVVIFGGRARG